jgi:two-component system sensor histidine kinase TctE
VRDPAAAQVASAAPVAPVATSRRWAALRDTLGASNPHEPRSLFGEILDWMLAPLLLLWPMSLVITWLVAQTIANRPYDRELGDRVRSLARQAVAVVPAETANTANTADTSPVLALALARAELDRSALVLLTTDDEEQLFFQVLGRRGELVAGEARLAVPARVDAGDARGFVRYRDEVLGDEPVRVAYLWLASAVGPGGPATGITVADSEALVQVAETLGKRSRLATEIVKGVILPQFVILPVAVLLAWFALSRGFRPLAELQQTIRARESQDLSPIDERDVPEEVVPLVRGINDLLQRLDKSMGAQRHFLADAAHQLKTPLAGLRTQAELAAREIDGGRADPAALKHSLLQIALSSQRAAHMVNQLLAMARAEDHVGALRREPVDLAAVVREAVRDFVPRAIERQIDLGYEGPESGSPVPDDALQDRGPTWLLGEAVLLGELVRNLVDNALAYTPSGGTVTARVLADPFGQVVVLQVEDSGPGIPPAERELVFQPFYRALGTQVDGSGLGLAIVQEVAQRHGAEVTVADTVTQPRGAAGFDAAPGACFTVRFPVHFPVQSAQT